MPKRTVKMDSRRKFILLVVSLIVHVNGDIAVDPSSATLSSIIEQTKVPSTAINNQNVTYDTASVSSEMTSTIASVSNNSENQLKLSSTSQFNLITSTSTPVVADIITEVTSSSHDELTTQEHQQHEKTIQQTSTEDEINSETTISFGIRSFTVEVSKNDKVLSTTAVPKSTTMKIDADATKQTETIAGESFMPTASVNEKSLDAETPSSVTLEAATTTSTQNPQNAISTEQPHTSSYPSPTPSLYNMQNVLKSNLNILFNNNNDEEMELKFNNKNNNDMSSSHENEISNEIQIDKKLDNGLYRIKIGEITTDEFNTGYEDKLHQQSTKVNIDDFFPSKIEDFRPIIEISNEKMLKEKDVLHNEQVKPLVEVSLSEPTNIDGDSAPKTGTRINTSNVATSNIEIELIDESTVGINSNRNDRGIEIDEIITQVEEIVTEVPQVTENINTDNVFIPRRTKKFDPSTKQSNTQGPTRTHDFGMTKFNQKKENLSQATVNGKPEYSTTKFYNSKELYNEILHKASKSSSSVSATATLPPTVTVNQSNLIREKLLNTNKIPIDVSHISTTIVDTVMTTSTSTVTAEEVTTKATTKRPMYTIPTSHPRMLSRLEEKLNSLDCDIQNLSADSTVWRGNETHELNLPITVSITFFSFHILIRVIYIPRATIFSFSYSCVFAYATFNIDFDFFFVVFNSLHTYLPLSCLPSIHPSIHPSSENLIEIRYKRTFTHIFYMYVSVYIHIL